MQHGKTASLEFVSTLRKYRRQGVALTLGSRALTELFDGGIEAVSLSGASEAVAMYEKLGFHSYF